MKIEIKNLKHAAFASEETHCFEATVYVDGKRSFVASNDGHGGCDMYHPCNKGQTQKDVDELVKAIDEELGKNTYEYNGMTLNESLEGVVCDLVNKQLVMKDVKRDLKNKIIYFKGEGQGLYEVKLKPTDDNIARVKKQKWWSDDFILLNSLAPEAAAEFYVKQ